jgi:phospholipid/cholesterol/gamma-HCH transport system substrate-binding protein
MKPSRKRATDVTVGLFVTVGAILLVLSVFVIGQERRLFEEAVYLRAKFPNVAGLKVGAQVLLSGVDVGHVAAIEFPRLEDTADKATRHITVEMRVSEKVLSRIRQDSEARVDSMGLLGDKTINISLGSINAAEHKEGDTIASVAPLDVNDYLAQAQEVLDNVVASSEQLRTLLEGFVAEGGDAAVAAAARSLQAIFEEIETGDGLVHQVIYEERTSRDVGDVVADLRTASTKLREAVTHVEEIAEEVKSGEGLVHELVYGKQGQATVSKAKNVLGEAEKILSDVRNGPGLLHNLIYRDDNGEFITNLNAASSDIKDITAEVKKGQGTVGALLADPSVYEDLKVLLGNVKRNDALKALVRFSLENQEAKQKKK